MRFKNIRTYFYIALAASVSVRFLQYFYALDTVTGFIKPAYKLVGFGLLMATVLIALSMLIVSLFIRRCPIKLPRTNRLTGAISLALALAILYDLTTITQSANVPDWQPLLLMISGALAAAFFGAVFVKSLKNYRIPTVCFAAPVIYYLVRLIYMFTASSTLALVSDNLLCLAAAIFNVLFMFEFCLVANNTDQNTGYKKIAATGFTAVIFCISTTFPQLIAVAFNTPAAQRVDFSSSIVTFITGVFIYFFLRRHFSGSNLKKRRKANRSHTKFMKGDKPDNFYIG